MKAIRFKAFTLAEVLITLGIIGVVAALAIPPLVQNYQKMTYVTGLKKAYSTIQEGFKRYLADEGVASLSNTDIFFQGIHTKALDDMLYKYFKITKICKATTSCEGTYTYIGLDPQKYSFITFDNNNLTFYTIDGMKIYLAIVSNCIPDNTKTGQLKSICMSFDIDLNGDKGPNILGRDFHSKFEMGDDGTLYPLYGRAYADFMGSDSYYWNTAGWVCGHKGTPNGSQGNCIARIMENGWQMDY